MKLRGRERHDRKSASTATDGLLEARARDILIFMRGRREGARASLWRLLAALLASSAAGCAYSSFGVSGRVGLETTVYEDGSLSRWGADVGLAELVVNDRFPVEARVFGYYDRHGENQLALYGAADLVPAFRPGEDGAFLPTLKPLVGVWYWVETPRDVGFLAGLRAGVGWVKSRGTSVSVEYAVLWFNDTLDDDNTVMQVVNLTVTRRR